MLTKTQRRARSMTSLIAPRHKFLPAHFAEAATVSSNGMRLGGKYDQVFGALIGITGGLSLICVSLHVAFVSLGFLGLALVSMVHALALQIRAEIRGHRSEKLYGKKNPLIGRTICLLLESKLDPQSKQAIEQTCREFWTMLETRHKLNTIIRDLKEHSPNSDALAELIKKQSSLNAQLETSRLLIEKTYDSQHKLTLQAEADRKKERALERAKKLQADLEAKTTVFSGDLVISAGAEKLQARLDAAKDVEKALG